MTVFGLSLISLSHLFLITGLNCILTDFFLFQHPYFDYLLFLQRYSNITEDIVILGTACF